MSLPITYLESVLNDQDYHNPCDLAKIQKLEQVVKKLEEVVERYSKEKEKLSSEQKVEGLQAQEKRRTKRSRSYNKEQVEKRSESTS